MDHEFPDRLKHVLTADLLRHTGAHPIINPKLPQGFQFPNMNPDQARRGAVLVLFYQKENIWHFPLIQRPIYEGVHSGQIAFPGGRKEDSDADLIATALRESEEEVGVVQGSVTVLGSMSDFFVAASNHLVRPVVGLMDRIPVYVPDEREVASIIEAPLHDLMKQPVRMKEISTSRGYTLVSPTFEFEDKLVWGATAMMLTELKRMINLAGWDHKTMR